MIEMIETDASAVAEYSATQAGLQALRSRLSNVAYDLSTIKGMQVALADRAEVRKLRTGLERMRTEIKAPALERCRLIDAEAKRITGELYALEQPIDAQIKAEEDRKAAERAHKEQMERERIAAIQSRIGDIRMATHAARDRPLAEIRRIIAEVSATVIDDSYQELHVPAVVALSETLATLRHMETQAERHEAEAARQAAERAQVEAQRIENARVAAELAERKRQMDAEDEARRVQAAREKYELAEQEQRQQAAMAEAKAQTEQAEHEERKRIAVAAAKSAWNAYPNAWEAAQLAIAEQGGNAPTALAEPAPTLSDVLRNAITVGDYAPTTGYVSQGIGWKMENAGPPPHIVSPAELTKIGAEDSPLPTPGAVMYFPAPAQALALHALEAFNTRLPKQPKPSVEWWAELRRLATEVAA